MFFSVIMPVYNKAQYIRDSVLSVLSQQHLKELIAIDDGSDDGSGEILDELAKHNNKLIIIHQKNKGVSAARNTGIELISGEYVCFCDADDTLNEHFFESAYTDLAKNKPDIAFYSYESQSPSKAVEYTPSPFEGLTTKENALAILYNYQIKTGYFGLVTNKLTRSKVIKKCSFDTNLKLAEDWDYWTKVMRIVDNCLFSQIKSFKYLKELPESSCFNVVDYPSQFMLRLRYKRLLEETAPDIDIKELNINLSHYVYFSISAACLKSIKYAKEVLLNLFKSGYKRCDINYSGLPPFHKTCLFLIKHKFNMIAIVSVKIKQVVKGQKHV